MHSEKRLVSGLLVCVPVLTVGVATFADYNGGERGYEPRLEEAEADGAVSQATGFYNFQHQSVT